MKNSEIIDLEKLEQLIQSKSYSELSKEEKEWVGQWVLSTDEYESLRSSGIEIRQYFQNTSVADPDSEILTQLTSHLRRIKSRQNTGIFWQLKPSLGAILMSILVGGFGWWIGKSTNDNHLPQTFNPVVLYDTIFIASKPDTIYTEKVIYKYRPVNLTQSANTDVTKSAVKNGISMKEKEELEKLLVSGTE